ncbi:MAG: oligosaccharide flippase family protein [Candidatus Acidiferrales bacterium]
MAYLRAGKTDGFAVSLVWSASLTLAFRVVLFGLALATNIILARSLGPTGRGVYAIAILVPSIITMVASLGIGQANVYYVSRASLEKRRLVASSLAAAILVGIAAYALLVLAVWLWGQRTLMGVEPRFLLLGGLSLPFTLAATFMQGVLHGERRFVQLNAVLLSQSASLAVFLLILLFVPVDKLLASVAAWTASSILTGLLAVALVGQHTPISLAIHLPTVRAMLRYGSLTYLGTLTSFVNYRFDLLLVNVFSGATQVGFYAVGAGVAEIIWFLPNSVYIALAPRVAAAPDEESGHLSAQATRSILVLAAASAILLALAAPFAISAFFGPAFAPSVLVVWLLLPGIVTFSGWKIMSCYLLGRNALKRDLTAAATAMIVTLALDFSLIPGYGFRGAAVASSIAYTIAMLVDLIWVVRRSGLSPRWWLIAVQADSQPIVHRFRLLRLGWGQRDS